MFFLMLNGFLGEKDSGFFLLLRKVYKGGN